MSRRASRRRTAIIAVAAVALGLAVITLYTRPWLDGYMVVTVSLTTDAKAKIVHEWRELFSKQAEERFVLTRELDLSPWEGDLLYLEVGGRVAQRFLGQRDEAVQGNRDVRS